MGANIGRIFGLIFGPNFRTILGANGVQTPKLRV